MRERVLIIGGGVVGLSLAYELVQRNQHVQLLDRGDFGKEASWAGAGMLPPLHREPDCPAFHQLTKLSHQLHGEWACRLHRETGIDTGFRPCGAIYFAEKSDVERHLHFYAEHNVAAEVCGTNLTDFVPGLQTTKHAYRLLNEAQLRNPWHLRALLRACSKLGVERFPNCLVEALQFEQDTISQVKTPTTVFTADKVVVCGGAWSRTLLQSLGIEIQLEPVRGQIVLLNTAQKLFEHILIDGKRYLVPRDDGRILVGATEENVGFEKRNTSQAILELLEFANSLVPALKSARFETCWSGLRPSSADKLPYLGRVPKFQNLYVATGHGRNGLQLSPGTARVMAELICDRTPSVSLETFRFDRHDREPNAIP